MSADMPEILSTQGARLQEVIAGRPGVGAKLKRVVAFVWKLAVGAFFCGGMFGILGPFSVVGAVLAVGWTYRLMQRAALQVWWDRSPEWYSGVRFETMVATNDGLSEYLYWPNWLLGKRWFSSLVENFRIGLRAVMNSFALTLVPGLIWFLTWEAGWDNSFNFGYEQTFVNPSRYVFGMLIFIGVMFYLPMAQARQAVTGDWKSFYDFKAVRKLVKRRWFACLVLAGLYAVISIPVKLLTLAPYFFGSSAEFEGLSSVELLKQLHGYVFVASIFVFAAFVFLHLMAARLYAGAVRDALQDKVVDAVGFELVGVEKLHIDVPDPRPERPTVTRFILWTGSLTGRGTAGVLTAVLWFLFSFQIVVSQFFKFEANPLKGWINQPLVQMPWFDLVPDHLRESALEELREER